MEPLIQMFRQDTDFQATVEGLNRRLKEQMVAGLSGTARMVYVAALHRETERPILLVTHNLNQAQKAVEDLYELLPREQVLLYPANELVVTEVALAGQETLGERMEVLSRLSRGFTGVLVDLPVPGGLQAPRRLAALPSRAIRRWSRTGCAGSATMSPSSSPRRCTRRWTRPS